jgi:hypothetical protein
LLDWLMHSLNRHGETFGADINATVHCFLDQYGSLAHETSSDAICAACFDDPGIVRFIKDHLELKTCSLCERTSEENIAALADEVLQFFLQKICEHYEDANDSAPYDGGKGGYQVHTYLMYDLVFHESSDIAPYETLEFLYDRLKDDIVFCDRDWQIMTPGQRWRSAGIHLRTA